MIGKDQPPPLTNVIERIGFGWAQVKLTLIGGGVWAADGAELLLLGGITAAISKEWDLNAFERGFVVSIVFLGVLAGNFISGHLGDYYGRRFPIILSYFCVFFSSVISVFSWNFASLAVFRFFVGLAFGTGQPAWNTFGGEISPIKYRLLMNAGGQLLFTFGEMYSAMLIYIDCPKMKELDWRWLILMGSIPSLILLLASYFMLPESPYFLAADGRKEEGKRVLQDIADMNCRSDTDCNFQMVVKREDDAAWTEKVKVVFSRQMVYSTIALGLSCFNLNFLFYGGLYAFPQVLPDLNLSVTPAMNLFVGALFEIPGYVIGVLVGNAIVRKKAMQIFFILMILSLALFLWGAQHPKQNEIPLQIGFLLYKMNTSIGFIVIYVYTAEIYPTSCRNTGTAFCLGAGRIGALICPLVYEWLTHATGTFQTFIYVIVVFSVLNMVLVYFLPYETHGRELPEDLNAVALLKSGFTDGGNEADNVGLLESGDKVGLLERGDYKKVEKAEPVMQKPTQAASSGEKPGTEKKNEKSTPVVPIEQKPGTDQKTDKTTPRSPKGRNSGTDQKTDRTPRSPKGRNSGTDQKTDTSPKSSKGPKSGTDQKVNKTETPSEPSGRKSGADQKKEKTTPSAPSGEKKKKGGNKK